MLTTVVALQFVLVIAVIALFLRKPPVAQADPALAQLPELITRLDARADHVRDALVQMRTDIAEESRRTRDANAADFGTLRTEIANNITAIGQILKADLNSFRDDNRTSDEQLRNAVQAQMDSITQRLGTFTLESSDQQTALRESFNAKLNELMSSNTSHQEKLRAHLEQTMRTISQGFSEFKNETNTKSSSLEESLNRKLVDLMNSNAAHQEKLRADVEQTMRTISQGFSEFKDETNTKSSSLEESLNRKLVDLMNSNAAHQEKLRTSVEDRLNKLNVDNTAKLEEMRATVDEKLHATLQTRLTESFGAVSDQLMKVHTGLGEMTNLASGVNDLNRMFTNVSRRGGVGEAILGQLISQVLAPVQFREKVNVNPATREVVEYAVRLPSATGETLLPIDSKFPREDWNRLQVALDSGVAEDIKTAGKKFDSAIRTQAKLISETYINVPITTPHAIMFLPSESLYAEVIRRDGLQADIQRTYHITIAGPSTLSAILISFKMGFELLNLQQKGNDVWKVLASTRTEFNKFGKLMDSVEKQVGTVQNTIHDIGVRTRAINRTLSDVGEAAAPQENVLTFNGVAPQLAASSEDG